jgi:hypothetical protein
MFNVTRNLQMPDDPQKIILVLKEMFYNKCYLCEDELSDPDIEHFIPHEGDDTKKFDWNNMYYACRRCNRIKGTLTDILDCCDPSIDVFRAVKCKCPSNPDDDVFIEAQSNNNQKIINTAKLLNRCYNENNTGTRIISRVALHEKIFKYYFEFIQNRMTLKNQASLQSERDAAIEKIYIMTRVTFPFAVFWRWHILTDKFLLEVCKEIIDF